MEQGAHTSRSGDFRILRGGFKKVKALVDTGTSLSVLLKRMAEELGIEAESVDEVATGAGIIKEELHG